MDDKRTSTTRPAGPRAAVSWSGGKDAWLATLRAREQGLDVRTFVTMCDEGGDSLAHQLPDDWIAGQVAAVGGRSWRVRVPPGGYAQRFDEVLDRLRASGHTHMVFGDIDLAGHRDWIEPRVRAHGLEPVFPLWHVPRRALSDELLARGVRARVVCVEARALDASFCGRDYDAAFVASLPAGVCPCGEDGEFHTFVYGGPGFARPLEVVNGPRVRVEARPPMRPGALVHQRLAGTAPWTPRSGETEGP